LLSKLSKLYNTEELKLLQTSFAATKNICVFLNTLKTTNQLLENEFIHSSLNFRKLNDFCYIFTQEEKSKLSKMDAFNQGHFYIQNYSSYLCAKNLKVKAGENVLDMCAAPGGKSINLANFMQNQGYLACIENNKTRFFTLKNNLSKYGVTIAKCFLKDARIIGKICPLKFDKILLDAPCSTLAKTGLNNIKNSKEIKKLSRLQKQLLHSALNALKHQGEMIYSTCTFLKEENEEIIENALKSNFKIELLELDLENANSKQAISPIKELKKARRILASQDYDGFFIAKIRKL